MLRGHRGSVLTLCCLGGLLLSGGRDNIIRVWDVKAMVCRHTLSGHKDDVLSICGLSIPGRPASSGDLQHLDSQVGDRLQCCTAATWSQELDAGGAAGLSAGGGLQRLSSQASGGL